MKNKKQKRNLYKSSSNSTMEYSKAIKLTIIVVIVLALTYFATAILSGEIKLKKEKEVKEEVSIQYEEIIAGQIFNRQSKEYYVLLFNFTDTFASYYLSLIDTYKQEENSLPFHIVDLEKKVNEQYVLKEGEGLKDKPSNLADLKVANPTIIKIKDKKVVERITGNDKIIEFFK